MPRLWNETIESHRHQVRDAILDAAADLVFGQGLRAVSMTQIAEHAGIGRATLYKYFPDIEAILHAWHAKRMDAHLDALIHARDRAGTPAERLRSVLALYAHLSRHQPSHDADIGMLLHGDRGVAERRARLQNILGDLIAECVQVGDIRPEPPVDELAVYCLHALSAVRVLSSDEQVDRLVGLILAGLLRDSSMPGTDNDGPAASATVG